jgi:hypothetical protein
MLSCVLAYPDPALRGARVGKEVFKSGFLANASKEHINKGQTKAAFTYST